MLPPKEKTILGLTKSVTMSKFKVYSENCKVNGGQGPDNVYTNSSRTSNLLKKGNLLLTNTTLKGVDLISGAEKSRVSHDPLGKMKVQRKALADVSNIRQNSSRLPKPSGSRNSMNFATLPSTAAASGRSPAAKVKALARVVTVPHISAKASTNSMRTSSNFQRIVANKTVHTLARNSFPIVKKPRELGSSNLQSQGNNSTYKSTKKVGFPVKRRASGMSHQKTKDTKGRASDSFTRITQRMQARTDDLQGSRKSVQPISRTTLQNPKAQMNNKSRSICRWGKPLGVTSGRSGDMAKSSVPETGKSSVAEEAVLKAANSGEGSDNKKRQMVETTSSKQSTRRKSYSSALIYRPKYIEAKKEKKLPNIDDKSNPLEVAEYVDDIYQYYWIVEAECQSLENYLIIQTDITPQMRCILINWLVEVHVKFDLMEETLYLAVGLLDRYLSLVQIAKRELQLVGLTSLLLASKYEDFWHPRVKDLISISAESYTRKQILEMEKDVLKKLKFRLNLPTAYVFMLRFLKASHSEKKLEHLAFFLIELCLIDYEALKFRPSLLCASAVYVARCTLKKSPAWTSLLEKHAHYNEQQIRECAQKILSIHKAASSSLLKVIHDKYKQPKFNAVTAIKPLLRLP